MDNNEYYQLPESSKVTTVHILKSGEIISTVQDFMKVEDRFAWVDKSYIVTTILRLRRLTTERKQSIIAIYEEGRQIKEYINVEHEFLPLVVSKKSRREI